MYSRSIKLPTDKSFFLFGPRGTGKSTLVRARYPDAPYIDLLDGKTYQRLLARPDELMASIPPNYSGYIIIDEIQRIPELLNEVHRQIESDNRHKFILTGSSARKLRRRGTNLLAGRALTYFLSPMTAEEVGKDFSLPDSVRYGSLPAIYKETDRSEYLESYVSTYLQEEVLQEGLTRNLGAFSRFLETASFSVGSPVNTSSIARDSAIERKVVENYFTILEDLMLGVRIPVFSRKAKRKLISHPKFYFFDVGIFQTLRPRGILDNESEIGGPALENLFLQNAIAVNNNLKLNYKISYYRTVNGVEVDLILYGPKGFHAFEVKNSSNFSSSHLRGLKAFGRQYPEAKLHLLYTGNKELYFNKITVSPIKDILPGLSSLLTT
jgi:uncharacterized protein